LFRRLAAAVTASLSRRKVRIRSGSFRIILRRDPCKLLALSSTADAVEKSIFPGLVDPFGLGQGPPRKAVVDNLFTLLSTPAISTEKG
jgi:hypothetical protein